MIRTVDLLVKLFLFLSNMLDAGAGNEGVGIGMGRGLVLCICMTWRNEILQSFKSLVYRTRYAYYVIRIMRKKYS